uniref:Toxin-antitoxin system toxin component, PIN family n=1 Tax=uncultured Thiotrichaceae bacterium TaxID=298394 RepID=A0A6S6SLC9_9GAMM|nr:MAG: Putative toxin-antitoxin system toxin component, PIN family [uncultured Thiotrichaceae bacterium]
MIVVLDTNIFVAGLRSNAGASYQLLRLVSQGKLDYLLSVPLLLEYEVVLKREKNLEVMQLSIAEVDQVLDSVCAAGSESSIFYLWRPKLSDPQDDMVLELAVNGQADAIVTFNLKDFGDVPKSFGIELLTPGAFLQRLRQEN